MHLPDEERWFLPLLAPHRAGTGQRWLNEGRDLSGNRNGPSTVARGHIAAPTDTNQPDVMSVTGAMMALPSRSRVHAEACGSIDVKCAF